MSTPEIWLMLAAHSMGTSAAATWAMRNLDSRRAAAAVFCAITISAALVPLWHRSPETPIGLAVLVVIVIGTAGAVVVWLSRRSDAGPILQITLGSLGGLVVVVPATLFGYLAFLWMSELVAPPSW